MMLLQDANKAAQQIDAVVGDQAETVFNGMEKLKEMGLEYAPKILGAIVIYIVGTWIIKWITRVFVRVLHKREFDPSLQSFLGSFVKISLTVLLFITIFSRLGANITSFAALLAGAGLAIGAALNGTLGNLAGGVMILVFKPFRVGDLIEAQDHFGIVTDIGIADTTVLTSQNKTVHLPNGDLSTGVITNYTDQENLRIDIKVAIKDKSDVDVARKIAIEAMKAHPKVITNPAPDVKVAELTTDGPVLILWPRIQVMAYDPKNPRQMEAEYYSVYFGVREMVYKAFVKNGIETPDETFEVTMAS